MKKAAHFFVRVVLLLRQRDSHSEEMIGLKSEFLFTQIPDGLNHQPGAHQQGEGQRELPHY
jgi:hypothetical protein